MCHQIGQRVRLGLWCLLGVAVISGCGGGLTADRSDYLVYNQSKDEFGFLSVYENIYAQRITMIGDKKATPAEIRNDRDASLSYLGTLWENRSDLIMVPIQLSNDNALLVVGSKEFRFIDLQSRASDKPEVHHSLIDLSQIVVRPGEFVASSQGTLSYFHRCYVSGRFVDESLKTLLPTINSLFLDRFLEVRAERKDASEKALTLADVRLHLQSDMPHGTYFGDPRNWDDESLRLLIHQASGGQVSVTRDRHRLIAKFKVSPSDAAELPQLLTAFKERYSREIAKEKSGNSENKEKNVRSFEDQIRRLKGYELKHDADGTVTFGHDLPIMISTPKASVANESNDWSDARDDLAAIEARGVPVNRSLSIPKVVEEFRAAGR